MMQLPQHHADLQQQQQQQLQHTQVQHHLDLLRPTTTTAKAGSSSSSSASSVGQRSSGDGGSAVEDDIVEHHGYDRLKRLGEEEELEEDHYSLIRQPDGREYHHQYRQVPSAAMYEEEQFRHPEPSMESAQVREKVYETLRRRQQQQQQDYVNNSSVMTSSSESGHNNAVSIKGIRPRLRQATPSPPPSPPELPPPANLVAGADPSCLYARVDVAKKRTRRAGEHGTFRYNN